MFFFNQGLSNLNKMFFIFVVKDKIYKKTFYSIAFKLKHCLRALLISSNKRVLLLFRLLTFCTFNFNLLKLFHILTNQDRSWSIKPKSLTKNIRKFNSQRLLLTQTLNKLFTSSSIQHGIVGQKLLFKNMPISSSVLFNAVDDDEGY